MRKNRPIMNSHQPYIQVLKSILSSGSDETTYPSASGTDLITFCNTFGDTVLCFFPAYPSLPKIKYLLWNYENLRSELKIKVRFKIIELWNLTNPVSEAEKQEEPSPCPDSPNHLNEIKIPEEDKKSIISYNSKMEIRFPDTIRKQDAFDRFLDFISLLARGILFSWK